MEYRLIGTWHFLMSDLKGDDALLHFTETGRAIQFMFGPQCAYPRRPMRLWYSIESPGVLRFRPKPEHEGWTRTYKFKGESFLLSEKTTTWTCRKAAPDQIPDWFPEVLDAALQK